MATRTTNYGLYKPDPTDDFGDFLPEFNANMDEIDEHLGGGGGSSSLAGLSDVNLTSPVTNDALIYDGAEWVNSPLSAVAFSGDYTDLSNAPTIPTKTSDLNNDSNFVSDASYVHTDNNFTNADVTKLSGIQAGAEVNVQSDWNEADNTADDYIKNKPTIPTKTSDLNNDSGFLDSSDITVTQIQTTGTKIATIDVDGNSTDLYAPTGGGGSYTEGDGIDITNNAISVDTTFTEASTRANIDSGDTFSTILGKIKKFFTDLKTVAFTGSYNDLSNKPKRAGSSTDGGSATTSLKMVGTDTRNVDSTPIEYLDGSHFGTIVTEFKERSAISAPGSALYGTLITTTPWHDGSGGWPVQTYMDNSGVYAVRYATNGTTWGSWNILATTSDIPDISGKVNKSGDTMTGNLIMDAGGVGFKRSSYTTMLYRPIGGAAQNATIYVPSKDGTMALDGNPQPLEAPRKNSQNLNNLPTQNRARVDECNSNSSNLPSAYWYYVFTIQGSDTGYAGQLAMQMTGGNAVYYRAKDGGTWSSWRSL